MMNQKGFTIVEMLLVVAIIAVLFAIVTSTFASVTAEARDSERITDVNAIHGHVELFYSEHNYYPVDETQISPVIMHGLSEEALIDPKGNTLNGGGYSYVVGPLGCGIGECASYTLATELESGVSHYKINLQ